MNTFYSAIAIVLTAAGVASASQEGGYGGSQLRLFIFSVINFTLFLIVLYVYALPRTKRFFSERSQKIRQFLKEAEEAKDLAEKKRKEYEEKLASLEKAVEEIRSLVEKEGQAEKERIVVTAEKEAETLRLQAKIIADQELKQAKADLKRELAKLSLERAEKIIKEKIDDDDHARLIKEYITQITP